MSEKQRILGMVEKHKAYFENVKGVDVAISTKGDFFFYEYDEKCNDYNTFVKFSTAEELEQIIEENIATDYCLYLQNGMEEITMAMDRFRGQEIDYGDMETSCTDMDRKVLVEAFRTFTMVVEALYDSIAPYKDWVQARYKEVLEDF